VPHQKQSRMHGEVRHGAVFLLPGCKAQMRTRASIAWRHTLWRSQGGRSVYPPPHLYYGLNARVRYHDCECVLRVVAATSSAISTFLRARADNLPARTRSASR